MRVLILGDTHGILDERILALAEGCDLAVHTGDVGGAAVLAALAGVAPEVVAVSGNNDTPRQWPAEDRAALEALPKTASVDLPGGRLVVEHGHRALPAKDRHAVLRGRHPDARAVAYGHSHRAVVDRAARPWVLNPGAAGRARTFGGPSALILTATARRWSVRPMKLPR